MTNQREGYCRVCGEYSQGVYIDSPGICSACAAKFSYPKSLIELEKNMKDLEPEFSKVVDDHFWELV